METIFKETIPTSAVKVKQFLETEYIFNEAMGSSDMKTAIRDILTDLIHICQEQKVEIGQKVQDALEVYYEEDPNWYLTNPQNNDKIYA